MNEQVNEVEKWISNTSGTGWFWYVKRLAGNDTLLTESHQAGPYIPKKVIFDLFPQLEKSIEPNPRGAIPVVVDSHNSPERVVKFIWYNKAKDECRITGWGGKSSPILDPDSTGSLCVFAFHKNSNDCADGFRIWLCTSEKEEEVFEKHIGSIDPGFWLYLSRKDYIELSSSETDFDPCVLDHINIQEKWGEVFPSGQQIIEQVLALTIGQIEGNSDKRLLLRRKCEFTLFKSIENAHFLPRVQDGFLNIDEFVEFANSLLQSRKSRAGRSLELQTKSIFFEEGLTCFAHDKPIEGNKRPDFLFPGVDEYENDLYPESKLRMLAAKTTCKDRWRQVCSEADRIRYKHLLTLQEGVSLNQFKEMEESGILLVVPSPLQEKFHDSIRPKLISLDHFIGETKSLCC